MAQPSGRWWEQFGLPELNVLVVQSLQGNPGLAAARERLRAAELIGAAGIAGVRPQLAVGIGPQALPGAAASYLQVDVGGRWELPLFGRGYNSSRLITAATQDAIANRADAWNSLAAETVRAFLDGRCAAAQIAVAEQLLNVSTARQSRLVARLQAGLENPATPVEDRKLLVAAQDELEDQRQARRLALERLAQLLGRNEVDEGWLGASDQVPTLSDPPATIPAEVLRRRPDVQHAEWAVERAAAQLGLARAEYYPHIGIEGGLTLAAPIAGRGRGWSSLLSAGPSISLPLFDWGLRRAQSDSRAAELRAASFEYRQVVLDAVADIESAFARFHEADRHLDSQAAHVQATNQLAMRVSTLRKLGVEEPLAALDAERGALLARQSLNEALHAQAGALVHLYEVLGAGVTSNAEEEW